MDEMRGREKTHGERDAGCTQEVRDECAWDIKKTKEQIFYFHLFSNSKEKERVRVSVCEWPGSLGDAKRDKGKGKVNTDTHTVRVWVFVYEREMLNVHPLTLNCCQLRLCPLSQMETNQNRNPIWFEGCKLNHWMCSLSFKKLFPLHSWTPWKNHFNKWHFKWYMWRASAHGEWKRKRKKREREEEEEEKRGTFILHQCNCNIFSFRLKKVPILLSH